MPSLSERADSLADYVDRFARAMYEVPVPEWSVCHGREPWTQQTEAIREIWREEARRVVGVQVIP